jgi:AcrR family transcriptional regulator
MTTTAGTAGLSRRERLREATLREIQEVARRLLVQEGAAAISLRAIAREMGMTAPALYRYHPSHTDLVAALTAGLYDELTDELEKARDTAPDQDLSARILAVCRTLRRWSLAHPAEFGLMFASPLPHLPAEEPCSPKHEAGMRFGLVFYELVLEQWQTAGYPTPEPDELDPWLLQQLAECGEAFGGQMPPQAVHTFLVCWTRLYGLVCMEVFGQLGFALQDVGPMFEECLRELGGLLGLTYTAPVA